MTKTISQLCREFLNKNASYSLKALEEEAEIGKAGKRQGKVLSEFKNGGGLSDAKLVRLVACLLKKGLKITPNQAYASVEVETETLFMSFLQASHAIETVQEGGTTVEYVETIHKATFDRFDFTANPRTPKKNADWWLTRHWEQTPLPAMQPLMGLYIAPYVVIETPFGGIVGKISNAQDFALTEGQQVPLRRVSNTDNLYDLYEITD